MDIRQVDDAELDPRQRERAAFGRELFARLLASQHDTHDVPFATLIAEDVIAVARQIRGGGSILLGPDGGVLFLMSAYPLDRGVALYRDGARSSIASFGAP